MRVVHFKLICVFFADKVKFDNSYSWVNSKRLSYSIEVVNMEEIQTDTESMISCSSGSTDPEAFQDAPNCVQTTL